MMDPWILACVCLLGLLAGAVGGLLGVGGSIIMIPGLVLLFGQGITNPGWFGNYPEFNQHLYQAAAMAVNCFVAVPATFSHVGAGAVLWPVLRWMIPAGLAAILAGVWVSNLVIFSDGPGPVLLGRVMAGFILYAIGLNIWRLLRRAGPETSTATPIVTPTRSMGVGLAMGFVGGLLGVGGGLVAVPLQQMILRLPLRQCIANSAAVMCVTSLVGAVYKNATLDQHGLILSSSLLVAAALAPGALVGGYLGGRLTHTLPVPLVRVVFVLFMVLALWKMVGW